MAKPSRQIQQAITSQSNVRRCATPRIQPSGITYACANRIQLYIGQRTQSMIFIHGARVKATLPKMAGAPILAMKVVRVLLMGPSYRVSQRTLRAWNSNDMHMITHEAVRHDPQLKLNSKQADKFQVLESVLIVEEYWLSIVAPLSDMVCRPGDDYSCDSWHVPKID